MRKLIKKLEKELLNKKMTLLEMNNLVQTITGSSSSLFDNGDLWKDNLGWAYWIEEDQEIEIDFEIIEENEDVFETEIKVTSIWKL